LKIDECSTAGGSNGDGASPKLKAEGTTATAEGSKLKGKIGYYPCPQSVLSDFRIPTSDFTIPSHLLTFRPSIFSNFRIPTYQL
jgi:hypothetical protein